MTLQQLEKQIQQQISQGHGQSQVAFFDTEENSYWQAKSLTTQEIPNSQGQNQTLCVITGSQMAEEAELATYVGKQSNQ